MTEFDHYREAERLAHDVAASQRARHDGLSIDEDELQADLALAQVHATLALAAPQAEAITAPARQSTPLPDSETEQVAGLRALVDMLDANPRLGEITRYGFDHINVPLNISDDPREALQAMVTAALAHGATPSLLNSGGYVGVLLSWGARVSVHVYDRPERLGDVAALLPAVEAARA